MQMAIPAPMVPEPITATFSNRARVAIGSELTRAAGQGALSEKQMPQRLGLGRLSALDKQPALHGHAFVKRHGQGGLDRLEGSQGRLLPAHFFHDAGDFRLEFSGVMFGNQPISRSPPEGLGHAEAPCVLNRCGVDVGRHAVIDQPGCVCLRRRSDAARQ